MGQTERVVFGSTEMLENALSFPITENQRCNDSPFSNGNCSGCDKTLDGQGNQEISSVSKQAEIQIRPDIKTTDVLLPPRTHEIDPSRLYSAEEFELVAPDGGFAWWVLIASIVVNVLIPGTVKSFGILFVEFIQVFQATPAEAAWIPAISFFLYSSTGPFASALAVRFSDRLVTIVGGLLAAAGLCLSYFATSVPSLCLTYGVVSGLGSGLAYPIGVFIVAKYFDQKRGLANGLCTSGSALGSVLMPQLLQFLLWNYGYRKAIVIVGCLLLNVCLVAAICYDPIEKHLRKKSVPHFVLKMNTEVANSGPSEPIPIPERPRPIFHLGHETPPGEVSWSPKLSAGASPLIIRLSKEDHHSQLPFTRMSSTPEPPSLQSTTHSKLNLTAIPEIEDDAEVDWDFFKGLTPAKQKLIKLSTHAPTPPSSMVHLHGNPLSKSISIGESGMCRTMSLISNESTSSFRYVSTIHHGPALAAIQYDENVNRVQSTMLNSPPSRKSSLKLAPKAVKRKLFDFSLLTSPFFMIFILSCGTTAVSYTNFIILLPTYAHEKGYDKTQASFLLSMVAALDFVGRIGGAALSDLKIVSREWFFVVGLLCSGVVLTMVPTATSLSTLAIVCACFGFFSGTYIGVTAVILAERLGPQRLGSSYSISLFLNGILQLGGPPICGLVFEHLKTNEPIFIALGAILILGSSLWVVVPFLPAEKISQNFEQY